MRICQLCTSPKVREADARLLAGVSQRQVARQLGLDHQVVGRHVRNGHVKKGNAAAGSAWMKSESLGYVPGVTGYVYSADEVAMNAWVDERVPAAIAAATGKDETLAAACWLGADGHEHGEACEVPTAVADGILDSLEAEYRRSHQVQPGAFEPAAAMA